MPSDRYLILLVLIMDMSNTVIRDLIALVSFNPFWAGVATVVMYILVGIIALHIAGGVLGFQEKREKESSYGSRESSYGSRESSYGSRAINILEILGAILYYYGDNISYILTNYGDALGCYDQCKENNRIAAVVLLGTAMLTFHVLPLLIGRLDKAFETKEKQINAIKTSDKARLDYAVDMIAMLLRIDVLFTIIAIMTQSNNYCSLTDVSLGWSMFFICSIIGIITITISAIYIDKKLNANDEVKVVISVVAVVVIIALPLYLLADNQQPLDCVWGCDSFASNSTRMDAEVEGISCNEWANSGLRLGFIVTSLMFIVGALIGLKCFIQYGIQYGGSPEISSPEPIPLHKR